MLTDELPPAASNAVLDQPLAEITPVPRNQAGRLLGPPNSWISAALVLLPIPVGLIGAIGAIGLGIHFSAQNGTVTGVLVGLGLLWAGLCVGVLIRYQQLLASRYIRWAAGQAFAKRVNSLVKPSDSDVEFVDIVPRANWQSLEPADVGFWRIDHSARQLLFEGDSKRYRIPFESVTSCRVEDFCLGSEQWEADRHFVTVVTAETAHGSREIPLIARHLDFGVRRTPQRQAKAQQLCDRIQSAIE